MNRIERMSYRYLVITQCILGGSSRRRNGMSFHPSVVASSVDEQGSEEKRTGYR